MRPNSEPRARPTQPPCVPRTLGSPSVGRCSDCSELAGLTWYCLGARVACASTPACARLAAGSASVRGAVPQLTMLLMSRRWAAGASEHISTERAFVVPDRLMGELFVVYRTVSVAATSKMTSHAGLWTSMGRLSGRRRALGLSSWPRSPRNQNKRNDNGTREEGGSTPKRSKGKVT